MKDYREFCGALHLHTTYSDGGTDMEELIKCAQSVGLDYIAVTDHMTLEGKGYEGLHDGLFVIAGYEHNDEKNLNHYLALGVDKVFKEQKLPAEYIKKIRDSGGAGFIAHPMERRHYFRKYPPYPWTEWDVKGFDGIELWNQMSEWVENLKNWLSFIRIFYPRRFLSGVQRELMEWWDRENMKRFVSGVGGVDGHSFRFKAAGFIPVCIFPVKVELKGVRTHLYLPAETEKTDSDFGASLISALRDGNGFISYYRRGDASGTEIYLESAQKKVVLPGRNTLDSGFPFNLIIRISQKADIIIFRNGIEIKRLRAKDFEFNVSEKGLYRVEVHRKGKAWIYSNPFPLGIY